jgi:hypothetical protein
LMARLRLSSNRSRSSYLREERKGGGKVHIDHRYQVYTGVRHVYGELGSQVKAGGHTSFQAQTTRGLSPLELLSCHQLTSPLVHILSR